MKLKAGEISLYHYTDLNGLLGIVEKHDLWLTHSRYSNDDQEMTHGSAVVKGAIEQAKAASKHDPTYLELLLALTGKLEGVYICCFCEDDNLLSQWRGHAANGVSIQFAPANFADVAGPDNTHGLLRLWRVFYQPHTQAHIIDQAIDYFAPSHPNNQGQNLEVLARRCAEAMRFFIPTFKNADFTEEKEWRLLFTPSPATPIKPRFRVSRNMLVPFYSLRDLIGTALPALPIQRVLVGPAVHKKLNVDSAQTLLTQNGYGQVPVLESNTPYRG